MQRLLNEKLILIIGILSVIVINVVNDLRVLSILGLGLLIFIGFMGRNSKASIRVILPVVFMAFIVSFLQTVTIGEKAIAKLFILNFYEEGLHRGILTFLRVICSFSILMIMINAMTLRRFLEALRYFKVPDAFIEVTILSIKFIYIFIEEIGIMKKAQKARLGYNGYLKTLYTLSGIGGNVLIRAFDRSKQLAKSMKSRGYNGRISLEQRR